MKRLRDAGRITDALKYADRDTCPELRASVLMDLARISFSGMNAESNQSQKDAVIEQVNEVIELVKGYGSTIKHLLTVNYYRPQRSCEGYVFTRVCHSVHGRGGGIPACIAGGIPACLAAGGVETPPRSRRLLLRTVRILLECILVYRVF